MYLQAISALSSCLSQTKNVWTSIKFLYVDVCVDSVVSKEDCYLFQIATVDTKASGGKSRPRKPVTHAPPTKEKKGGEKKGKKEKA